MARSYWISLHAGVHEDEKTLALADALDLDPHRVVGHLTRLWLSVMVHRGSGDLTGVSARIIAAWSGWGGADYQDWVDNLISAGWLKTKRGVVTVTGWDACNGPHQRELERKRAWRRRSRDATATTGDRPSSVSTTADRTGQDRTGQKEKTGGQSDGVIAVFPLRAKGKNWTLTDEKLAELKSRFPEVNVLMELREARHWLLDHPDRQKTARGMPAFLSTWMKKAQKDVAAGTSEVVNTGVTPSVSKLWGQKGDEPTEEEKMRVREILKNREAVAQKNRATLRGEDAKS
jgi:hypothetical protein